MLFSYSDALFESTTFKEFATQIYQVSNEPDGVSMVAKWRHLFFMKPLRKR